MRIRRPACPSCCKRQIYLQEPKYFYFPELPQTQFYERPDFPWAAALEAATPRIRAPNAARCPDTMALRAVPLCTIEARTPWNLSKELRVVLLFDIWQPELTQRERALVAATLGAVSSFEGSQGTWSD